VRERNVADVDVVADARSVRGIKVLAVDDGRAALDEPGEHLRKDVVGAHVEHGRIGGARDVEVPEARRGEGFLRLSCRVDLATDEEFGGEFGLAIG
jgi:hypothetical protein